MKEELIDLGIQAIGFGAMALGILSYQAKKRGTILLLQSLGSLFWMTQFFLLHGMTGVALNAAAVLRGFLYSKKDKWRFVRSPWMPVATGALFVLLGILTYDGIYSLLPVFAMVISSVALYRTDEREIRLLSLLVSPPWLVYDAILGSLGGVLNECFVLVSIGVALIRFRRQKRAK